MKNGRKDKITAKEIENRIFSKKKRSGGTKNVYAVQIRAFLKFCRSLDLKVVNPELITVQKYHQKEARFLSIQEETKILERIKNKKVNPNLKAIILLMLTTGARVSEACSLQKQQFRNAEIVAGMYQIPITGKGQKTRAIFIPPKIYEELDNFSKKHDKKTIIPVNTAQIQKLIRQFSEEIAIAFTSHTLRHTFCTKLARKGIDLHKIQKIAGHKCIITTSRYLHTHNIELANATGMIANIAY